MLAELHELFDHDDTVHITTGKEVLELSVVKADKGTAMEKLRSDHNATAALFIGDDVTDEHVLNHWIQTPTSPSRSGLGRLPPGSESRTHKRYLRYSPFSVRNERRGLLARTRFLSKTTRYLPMARTSRS